MNKFAAKFQIGKQGITDGAIESLSLALKNHRQVRVSVLKSTGRDKEKIREIVQELKSRLKFNCDFKIIGFTIIIIKSSSKTKK